jgi:hypothetical protein
LFLGRCWFGFVWEHVWWWWFHVLCAVCLCDPTAMHVLCAMRPWLRQTTSWGLAYSQGTGVYLFLLLMCPHKRGACRLCCTHIHTLESAGQGCGCVVCLVPHSGVWQDSRRAHECDAAMRGGGPLGPPGAPDTSVRGVGPGPRPPVASLDAAHPLLLCYARCACVSRVWCVCVCVCSRRHVCYCYTDQGQGPSVAEWLQQRCGGAALPESSGAQHMQSCAAPVGSVPACFC